MNTREKLSWTLLGVAIFFGIAAVSTDTSFFKNASLTGWLSLSGATNRLTVADGALKLDGSEITGGAEIGDPFIVTSVLEDNETNVAMVVKSSNAWSTAGQKLLSLSNGGTNKLFITQHGGIAIGSGANLNLENTLGLIGPGDALTVFRQVDLDGIATMQPIYSEIIADEGWANGSLVQIAQSLANTNNPSATISISSYADTNVLFQIKTDQTGASFVKLVQDGSTLFQAGPSGKVTASGGFVVGSVNGITTTWTNMIDGVITQRITAVGGIVVTNLTL